MKTFNVSDIRSWKPCYDPTEYLAESWQGTAIDIVDNKAIPFKDRLWVVLRPELVSVESLKRYALACARSCEHLSTDARVKACNDATEAYLDGHITAAELRAAVLAAYAAYAAEAAEWAAVCAVGAEWAAEDAAVAAWATAWATADTGVSEDALIDKLKDFILDEQLASDERC